MINSKPLTRRIFYLYVIPLMVCVTLLLISFSFIQRQQQDSLEKQLFILVTSSLEANLPNAATEQQLLEQVAGQILSIAPFNHLSLTDDRRHIQHQAGLPVKLRNASWLDPSRTTFYREGQSSYMAAPFHHREKQFWLISGMELSPLQITTYRGYITLLLVAGCTLALVVYFASRLHSTIINPLEGIARELRRTLTDHSDRPLSLAPGGIYSDFIETLNQIILRQQSLRGDMQTYLEQSTKDLRETLETVEIQNIELDFSRKNALQASRAKSEFLANTSNELRTPLNGILGFTSLLLKTGLSDQQKDYLATIEQSAQGLLTVINDILDFSKLETGKLALEHKPVHIRELVEDVHSIYAPQAHEKNTRLLAIINHNVPHNLLGDPKRLKQVITNLISNAIKFSTRGNIVIRATSLGEVDGQIEIKFSISDNGMGLTEEQQAQLHRAFKKVDSSDNRFLRGAGLGLTIAKGLVDRMSGEIGVESEQQHGSTFWFTVRLGVDHRRDFQSSMVNSLLGLNILVYDVNPVCRMEITHLLTNWGVYYTEENSFNNLEASLRHPAYGKNIQLVILDAYSDENVFDKEKLVKCVHKLNANYRIPIIILAPPSIQRVLHDDILGLNTIIVARPVLHKQLHKTLCNHLNISHLVTPPTNREIIPANPSGSIFRKTKLLIVDDNPANQKLVCEFLKGLGAITVSAASGYEALEITKSQVFDLILMDVQMPGIDGLETTRLLRDRKEEKRTPIIALTALEVKEQKTRLLLAGMDDFLSKPVHEADLKNVIERWVDSSLLEKHPLEESKLKEEESTTDIQPPIRKRISTEARREDIFSWKESMSLAKQKPELAADMLGMLLQSVPDTIDKTREAFATNDLDTLLEVVHKFHGGCCYCGVPALREASKILEQALHQHSHTEALVTTFVSEMEALLSWASEHDVQALFSDFNG